MIIGGVLICAGASAISTAFSQPSTSSISKAETKEKEVTINQPPPKSQKYFPKSPSNFNPKGLIKIEHLGTKNGRIIEWRNPISNKAIFEWNEDLNNGEHYHALIVEWDSLHDGNHYLPGEPVPEPLNTIYFGG